MVDVVQEQFDKPIDASATVAAGAANVSEVTVTVVNAIGKATPGIFKVWLSDSASGIGYSATTASGAVTVKTAGTTGTIWGTGTAKFGVEIMTTSAATFILSITDTAKTLFKVCILLDGRIKVLATLATASYGP